MVPPDWKLKVKLAGLSMSELEVGGAAVTVRETATDCGELEAPVELTLTLPLYVPAARLPGLTETVTVPGVDPLPEADSQLPPLLVEAETA